MIKPITHLMLSAALFTTGPLFAMESEELFSDTTQTYTITRTQLQSFRQGSSRANCHGVERETGVEETRNISKPHADRIMALMQTLMPIEDAYRSFALGNREFRIFCWLKDEHLNALEENYPIVFEWSEDKRLYPDAPCFVGRIELDKLPKGAIGHILTIKELEENK